jgi:hypothetical protein
VVVESKPRCAGVFGFPRSVKGHVSIAESRNERSRDQDLSGVRVKYDHNVRFLIQLREEIVVNAM